MNTLEDLKKLKTIEAELIDPVSRQKSLVKGTIKSVVALSNVAGYEIEFEEYPGMRKWISYGTAVKLVADSKT